MIPDILPVRLEVAGVVLEPLVEQHRDALRAAGADPAVWAHMPIRAYGEGFDGWFDHALQMNATGQEAVFTVRLGAAGEPIGSTRYMALAPAHFRAEIGSTWYAPSVWGGVVNPACKFALLRHAFESLGLNRVELKTDNRNLHSQAAIAKLGAQREGVFRQHMLRPDGSFRDTVYFALIASDWPAAKAKLATRLKLSN